MTINTTVSCPCCKSYVYWKHEHVIWWHPRQKDRANQLHPPWWITSDRAPKRIVIMRDLGTHVLAVRTIGIPMPAYSKILTWIQIWFSFLLLFVVWVSNLNIPRLSIETIVLIKEQYKQKQKSRVVSNQIKSTQVEWSQVVLGKEAVAVKGGGKGRRVQAVWNLGRILGASSGLEATEVIKAVE